MPKRDRFAHHHGRKSEPTRGIRIPKGNVPVKVICAYCGGRYATTRALLSHFDMYEGG